MLGARAWVEALGDPEWPAWWPEMYACAMDFWLTLAYVDAGDDEWNAYNLYQGSNRTYRFGSMQGAHPVASGMIVVVCENPWYPLKVWVEETKTMAELDEPRFGFVHSCAFDEQREAWEVAIVVNLSRAEHVWEHPVWASRTCRSSACSGTASSLVRSCRTRWATRRQACCPIGTRELVGCLGVGARGGGYNRDGGVLVQGACVREYARDHLVGGKCGLRPSIDVDSL